MEKNIGATIAEMKACNASVGIASLMTALAPRPEVITMAPKPAK